MWKNIFKFFGIILVIAVLGAGALLGMQYVRYRNSPEYKAAVDLKNLEKQYAEDPYGGETPEETLRLFIDALKKGDTDLAARYFVLDKQEQWREDLGEMKDKNLLNDMVKDLEATRLTKKTEKEAFFTLVGKNNIAEAELIIGKNPYNRKWKIYEL